jgi:hypothetical protein
MGLRLDIKNKATLAFRDNTLLVRMTDEEREIAAQFYESVPLQGKRLELARRYNIERARFLRGEVSRVAGSAILYGIEIGEGKEADNGV